MIFFTFVFAFVSDHRIRLHLGRNGGAVGSVWFDDVKLEKVESIDDFVPLETVRWFGDGYRYDDRGWIVVHIEGQPYERGHQYGSLVPDEIVAYIGKLGVLANEADPEAGWNRRRFECDTTLRRT